MNSLVDTGLACAGLQVNRGRRRVLQDVSLQPLPVGSITILLGANGSGKTTLLKALAGLLAWQDGSARFHTRTVAAADADWRAQIAYMPQDLPAPVRLAVFEAVRLAWELAPQAGRHPRGHEAIAGTLAELGLTALAERYLDELSGGQRQLVALAQILARRPAALLLDEPLAALDLHNQQRVIAAIRRLTADRGLVTLMALHDVNLALQLADRVVLLAEGRVLAQGDPADVITPARLARSHGVRARIEHDSTGEPLVRVDGPVHRDDSSPASL